MEEEAKRSNAKTNQSKGRTSKIVESDKSDHSDHKKRRVKALAKLKETKEEAKELPVRDNINQDSIKEEFALKSQQNITVGNISSVKESSSGENLIQKFAPKAFRPPSYKNIGEDGLGFMPITSMEAQKSLNIPPNISNSNSNFPSKNFFENIFKNYQQSNLGDKEKSGNYHFRQGFISGTSNPNSADIGSLNINLDMPKNGRPILRMPSEGSFHSILPEFSKKGSQSIIFQNKSGSMEGKINGFIGDKGSFVNPNIGRNIPDNQR